MRRFDHVVLDIRSEPCAVEDRDHLQRRVGEDEIDDMAQLMID